VRAALDHCWAQRGGEGYDDGRDQKTRGIDCNPENRIVRVNWQSTGCCCWCGMVRMEEEEDIESWSVVP
jgi:hypothetical protein